MRGILTALILLLLSSISVLGQDQCKPTFEYSIKESTPNKFAISVKADVALNNPTLELYDLFLGKVVSTQRINGSLTSLREIFQNVKPSLYTINVKQEGCARTSGVGGKEGIKVGNK